MGSFFSALQGALFATMNAAVFAYLVGASLTGTESSLGPRVLVLFAGLMFLLGTVFMRALSVRRDPVTGGLTSGGAGLLMAAVVATYVSCLLAVTVNEMVLVVPAALFAVYVFAAVSEKARFTAPAAALFAMVLGLVAFSDVPFADPLADRLGSVLDLPASKKNTGRLEEPGSPFAVPVFAPVLLGLFTLAVTK